MTKEEAAAANMDYTVDANGNRYGLERSAHGSNAFYFGDCDVAGQTVAYCVCLKKIAMNKQGQVYGGAQNCCDAIERNGCKADRMRREESEAGHALFYIERARLNAKYEEDCAAAKVRMETLSAKKDAFGLQRTKRAAPADAAASVETPVEENGYAAAINKAMQETIAEQPKPAVASMQPTAGVTAGPVAVAPTSGTGGMSLIEMARARMKAAAAAAT